MFRVVPPRVYFYLFCTVILLAACTGSSKSSRPPDPQPQGATDKCGASKKSSDPAKNQSGTSIATYDLARENLWQDVKTIVGDRCVGCHAKFGEFETASTKIDNFIKFTDLEESQEGFMPKGASKLNLDERTRLILWRAAGLPESGGDSGKDEPGKDDEGGADITLGDGVDTDAAEADSSGIDADGSDWGDDPPPPPKTDC